MPPVPDLGQQLFRWAAEGSVGGGLPRWTRVWPKEHRISPQAALGSHPSSVVPLGLAGP